MNRIALASIAAGLALSTTACTQQTAQQLNTANANSQVYIGALTCNRHRQHRLRLRLEP